jgi:anti-sigma factor ChrR (cupin superfamily)
MESYVHELASLYALGALDGSERDAFEKHLADGCPSCEAEVASFREVAGDMAEVCLTVPPPDLRQRVLKAVRRSPQVPGVVLNFAGLLLSRSDEMPWEDFAPGIFQRRLFRDATRQYATTLIRMEPGARYPSHRHEDVEELFILSGDLRVAGVIMHSGDYCRAEPGSRHPDTHSVGGCTLLMMASEHNELL